MKNVFKLLGIIALAAAIVFSMAACSDGSGDGGGEKGWTWSVYDDSWDGGTSTVTMIHGSGADSNKINFSGQVKIIPNKTYGYTEWVAVPDTENLASLKTADSFSFKCKGDGKLYVAIVPTSDIEDYCEYLYIFEAAETETTVEIPYSELVQPDWGIQKAFNKNNITELKFQATEWVTGEGPFNITIENLQAGSGVSTIDSLKGTWNASEGRSIIFNGNTFNYKVNNITRYSGIFSVSGSTINFNEASLERANSNFKISGGTLDLSNHTWDSGVNGTYTNAMVSLIGVTANGSVTQTTTELTLTFSKAITGLNADDITISGVSGVIKGNLGGSWQKQRYTLPISGFTDGGNLIVAAAKSGYVINNSPRTVRIYYKAPVSFNSVTANGSSSQSTTRLTLTFSEAIPGLSAADITLSGVSGVTKGTLSNSGSTYTLPISGFTAGGTLNVAVAKSGYTINGSPKTVRIYHGGEEVLGSYDAFAGSSYSKLSSTVNYQIVNLTNEGRTNVMKVTNPGEWAVALYELSAYANKNVTITFSADVKRVGAAGTLDWQINNEAANYPSVRRIGNAEAGIWHSMSGSWTGTVHDYYPRLYLSTYQNNSDQTTYYIDNFEVSITEH